MRTNQECTIIHIPELLYHICSLSERNELVSFSQTCRSIFHATVPFVWETVHGVHKLLALLPNITISRPDDLGHKIVLYVNLPDPDGTSFERFDYYAPLVKHLSFFGNNTYYPDLAGWELLSERARKQPLFPNLLSLTVPEHFHEPLSEEQLCQISDLISPSLVAYWSVPIPSALLPLRVPKTAALVILDPLVERCSVIQCLAIYPKAGSQICQDLPASFGSLPFSHLRELSGSAALVASDLLVVIGALPQLESLSIHGFNQYLPPLPDELPGTSFPALKHLYFSTLYSEDALGLAQLGPLLCRLEFLELQVDLYAMDEDLDGDERVLALTQDIMSAWLEKTVCLRTLYMDVDPDENSYEIIDIAHLSSILKRITELRIENLRLNGMSIDPQIFRSEFDWSHLKELRLPHQHVTLENIHGFAALPCLGHLELCLEFSNEFALPQDIEGNHQLRTLQSSESSAFTCDFQDVSNVAGTLLKLWPNLREVKCEEEPGVPEANDEETAYAQINKRIASMRSEILANDRPEHHTTPHHESRYIGLYDAQGEPYFVRAQV